MIHYLSGNEGIVGCLVALEEGLKRRNKILGFKSYLRF
jgi:hypothetical protein